MPKRKRFRNRKGHKKRRHNRINNENTSPPLGGMASPSPETLFRELTNVTPILSTPKLPATPTPRSVISEGPLNNELQIDIPLITETPRRRSWNRESKSNYGSLNMTNLNVLFNSDLVSNTPRSECNITVKKISTLQRSRSKSSFPKLQSPNEKLISVSKSTQTIEADLYVKQINAITETPKYSTVLLQQNLSAHKSLSFLNNQDTFNKNDIRSEKLSRFFEKGVNINPYLKNQDIDGKNKNGSFGEISFFSPHLFQHKSSSTPIEKILNKAIEFDEQVGLCDLDVSKLIDNSFGTPKLNTNLNMNDGISPDKLVNKENSMKNLIHTSSNFCKKTPNIIRPSPKKKNILLSRIYSRTRHFSSSKLNVSRRSSTDSSRLKSAGAYEKILLRFKKYYTASQTWSAKVIDVCTQLGVQIKNSLSSICSIYKDNSLLEPNESQQCKCEAYKKDIEDLKVEIESLKKKSDDVDYLKDELKKVKEEIAQLSAISKDIQSRKEQCKCLSQNTKLLEIPIPPPPAPCLPPPPPPPLPPPPPPPPPTFMTNTTSLKTIKKVVKSGESEKDNSRPVISLDDILKVKLKKTSDRNKTPVNRYSSQPVISMDMLRQVKLRPASRNSLRAETPENTTDLTTSPHSTLCRLLKNESSVPRLKRLRRVGAYSYDSLYRKKEFSRRDRDDGS